MNAAGRRSLARTGLVITGVVIAFFVFDTVIHLANPEVVRTSMRDLGFSAGSARLIGVIELCCLALYTVRRTAPLGAVLLTGFLGGALAVNLRADTPILSTTLFPVYVGIAVWGGLVIRHADVRAVVTSILRPVDHGDSVAARHARASVSIGAPR